MIDPASFALGCLVGLGVGALLAAFYFIEMRYPRSKNAAE
jgi:hypothetical protein